MSRRNGRADTKEIEAPAAPDSDSQEASGDGLEEALEAEREEKFAYQQAAIIAESNELTLFREYLPMLKERMARLEAENNALRREREEQMRSASKAKESEESEEGADGA